MPRVRKLPVRVLLLKGNPDFDEVLERDVPRVKDFPAYSARLFWRLPEENAPKWVQTLFEGQGLEEEITTRSVSAVLVMKAAGKVFAITFGHGKSLIAQNLIEPRFGLKVVLNSVDPTNLRSIDAKSLDGSLGHKREQLPALSSLTSFGIDIERDFLRAVTGISKDPGIGNTISGNDSYSASVTVDITTLHTLLEALLTAYDKDTYKDNFEFIDNIAEVPSGQIDELDEELLDKIRTEQTEGIWLAPPDIVDWDVCGRFSFGGSSGPYEDIYLKLYLRDKVRNIDRLSITKLKSDKVFLLNPDEDGELNHWSVYKCLYADLKRGDKHFILSDGKWFNIKTEYVQSVKDYLGQNLVDLGLTFPEYQTDLMAIPDANGNKCEARYNALVAGQYGYTLLDRKTINYGSTNSKIELCDLYKPNLFVHIKRYTKSSGLSHLFNQGNVSAELLLSSVEFRAKAVERVISQGGAMDGQRPNAQDMTVAFGVVSASRGDLRLPFFSQVALKNAIHFMKNTLQIGNVGIFKIQATSTDDDEDDA